MAGNSERRGAIRKKGSKKGPAVGSGGQRRRGLAGKGPTPKASQRVSHPASKRDQTPEKSGQEARESRSHSGPDPRRRVAPDDVVVGRNPVLESLRASMPANELLVAEGVDADERIAEAVSRATDQGVPTRERPKRELDRAAGEANHQGIVLRIDPFEYADPQDLIAHALAGSKAPILVALDGITDPHNLGAIARSSLAFAAAGLIVPSRRSAGVTAIAWRSSAGAFARLPTARATNLARAINQAQEAGFFVVTLDGGAERNIAAVAAHFIDVPVLLVIGSEGAGVSRIIADRADEGVRIDMPGPVESLNASVAAGIALFSLAAGRG